MKKIYTFLFIIFFGLVQGCSSISEVEVKRYEDYFPSKSSSTYSQTSSTENYEVYTSDEYADEQKQIASANVTDSGKQYSDDGFFQAAPVEVNETAKSTGKCKAVAAPGPKKIGKPYKINGVTYYPMESADGYSEVGIASWYGPGFHGKLTANGERYNQKAMTAAHKTLPLPTLVKVENLENGKSIVVRVNDRGPYSKGRIIDLTETGARRLDMLDKGTAKVRVSVLSEDPDCYVSHGQAVNINSGNFAVQVGAFSVEDNAKRLAEKIGEKAVVSKGYAKGTEWHRVWVTGYSSKEQAENALSSELSEYDGAFVVRYK